LINRLKVLEFF